MFATSSAPRVAISLEDYSSLVSPLTKLLIAFKFFKLLCLYRIEDGIRAMKVVGLFATLLGFALFCHVASAEINTAQLGGTFSRSSPEPKYKIEFHSEESPFQHEDDQEFLVMPNENGKNFICYMPKVEETKSGKPIFQQNTSSMIVETEKSVKLKTPDELLEVLKDQCFIRLEGWWEYEFCYQKRLRQIHVEEEKVVQEFVLGVYDAEATAANNENLSDISLLKDPRSKDAYQRYHPHQYTNGTTCDLTNQPRETEVRFVCSEPRAMISSITEIATCKYAVTIQCPTLCKHPLFQAERPVWQTIHCNVLPKDYKETKAEDEESDETAREIVMVTNSESNHDSSQ